MSESAFMEVVNAGKITEARAVLKSEMEKARFSPDKITIKHGIATFTRRGNDAGGRWRLKK